MKRLFFLPLLLCSCAVSPTWDFKWSWNAKTEKYTGPDAWCEGSEEVCKQFDLPRREK